MYNYYYFYNLNIMKTLNIEFPRVGIKPKICFCRSATTSLNFSFEKQTKRVKTTLDSLVTRQYGVSQTVYLNIPIVLRYSDRTDARIYIDFGHCQWLQR